MKPFRRSKLKKVIVLEDQKIVQINSKLWIEVSVSVPDDIARERYEANQRKNIEALHNPPKMGCDFFR